MKFIQLFEGFDQADYDFQPDNRKDQEKIDDVKDVFQEYIDEYNIEKIPDNFEFDNIEANRGLYYELSGYYNKENNLIIQIRIYIQSIVRKHFLDMEDFIRSDNEEDKYWKLFFTLYKELHYFSKRLRHIGYKTHFKELSNYNYYGLLHKNDPFIITIQNIN